MAVRPKKYAHVVKDLPKLSLVEPERRTVVDTVKAEILEPRTNVEEAPLQDIEMLIMLRDMEHHVKKVLFGLKRACAERQTSGDYAKAYASIRFVLDKLDEWKSSGNLLLDAYTELMLTQFEQEGVSSLHLADGASISTYSEPYGKVTDKELFRRWCVTNGYENQLQLWPSTMNALVKERSLNGELPPDGVEVSAKPIIRLNKA